MKVLHIIPGLYDPTCGIAVAAKMVARRQMALGSEVESVDSGKWRIQQIADADEVWVHSMWTPGVMKAAWTALRLKKSLIRMTHGCVDPVRLKYHGWKKWLVGPIERYLLRKSDKIVVTCEAEAEWVRQYLGKKCPEIEVEDIKRFFDFSRKERKGRKDGRDSLEFGVQSLELGRALHLLYLGRRHPLKGLEFLEQAVREILTQRSRGAEKQSGYEGDDGESAIELKIVSDAFGEEKEKIWEWCDVLVLPTLSENFGLVVAEALERGKRVITTDGAPVWDVGDRGQELGVSVGYDGRLLYLKGYRDGAREMRVELLKKAIVGVGEGFNTEAQRHEGSERFLENFVSLSL